MRSPAAVADAFRAWRAAPSDKATEKRYRDAVAKARSGPVLHPGEVVADRFLLEEHRGDGALTATWRALDLDTERPVALKVLHARYLHQPDIIERFHGAARRQAEVAERGVLPVVDSGGEWHDFHWAAVAWCDQPLASRLASLDVVARRQVLLDVAVALQNAHTNGLSHGRLSPANILLDEQGAACLSDFGLVPSPAGDGPFAPPEASDPEWVPSIVGDRYAFAMVVAWVFRDGQLPYWASRAPERALSETAMPEDLKVALASSVAFEPEERPSDLGDVVRVLRGDLHVARDLAERAMAANRPETALDHYRHLLAVTAGDPDVRVDLARSLAASGRERQAIDQLYAAIRAPRLASLEGALSHLRALVDRTGEHGALAEALETRAREPNAQRDVLLLEVARIRARVGEGDIEAAWRAALGAHTRRDQARVCLWALFELACQREDWPAFVTWGRDLAHHLDEKADVEYRIGKAFLDHLHDPQSALLWLERAHGSGHPAADLQATLERIRTERGDWPQVIALLRHRADHDPARRADLLRRAARIARHAAADHTLATKLYGTILKDHKDDVEARWYLADRARIEGDPVAEREHLKQLDPESLDDSLPAEVRTHATLRLAQLYREDGDLPGATHLVRAARTEAPHHIGALWLDAALSRERGEIEQTAPPLEQLGNLLEAGSGPWCDALTARADLCLRAGDRAQAWALAGRVAELCPDDAGAAWIAARCTFGPPTDEPWLGATPVTFTPQEALARLLDGMLDPEATDRWLEHDPLCAPPSGLRLERSARLVNALLTRGLVDESLFDRLEALDPQRADRVRAVRQLWSGLAPDESFSVSRSYGWARPDPDRVEFDPRIHRRVLGPPVARSPFGAPALMAPMDLQPLLVLASDRPLAAEPSHVPTPSPVPQERPRLVIHPGTARQSAVDLDVELPRTIGEGPTDAIQIAGLAPARVQLVRVGGAAYLVSERDDLRAGHLLVSEIRLVPGVDIDIDGTPMEVVEEAQELPDASLLPVDEDERTMIHEVETDPSPVGLFTSDADDDYLIALTDTPLPLGDHSLRAEPDGWRLVAPDGSTTFLVAGDHFVVDGQRYTLRRIAAITPVPPPRLEGVDDRIPTLVIHDGTLLGRVVPLTNPRTTLGRGRDSDVRLGNDTRISRHHATVELRADHVVLTDAGSSNGTYVDGGQILDEHVLHPGEIIEVGDTTIEFRLGTVREASAPAVDEPDDHAPTVHVSPQKNRSSTPRVPLSEGRQRVAVANRALAPILRAMDQMEEGEAVTALQRLLAEAPKRYQPVFHAVPAKSTGLPVLPVLYNIAGLPDWEQRSLLSSALIDLVERASRACSDTLADDRREEVLRQVADTHFRKHLPLTS